LRGPQCRRGRDCHRRQLSHLQRHAHGYDGQRRADEDRRQARNAKAGGDGGQRQGGRQCRDRNPVVPRGRLVHDVGCVGFDVGFTRRAGLGRIRGVGFSRPDDGDSLALALDETGITPVIELALGLTLLPAELLGELGAGGGELAALTQPRDRLVVGERTQRGDLVGVTHGSPACWRG
jgi:hypothetical protein